MGLNPYLKNWDFRLQRIHTRQDGLRQWYDSKAEIKIAGRFKQSQAILLCIDTSGSMNDIVSGSMTRLQLVKQQLVDIIDQINVLRKDSAVTVHLGICAFSTSTNTRTYNNANDADFAAAKAFVNGLTASGGTDFGPVFTFANFWFGTNANTGGRSDTMVLITDGTPNPVGNFPAAIATGANIINQTGPFSGVAAIDLYAINVDLDDTTYTQQMDNTPWDGVPVINSTDTSALYNAVFFAVMGNSSAMNPAHIIRECLTDPLWGMGYLDSDIDDVAFQAAADRLYTEAMGISILWDTQTSIEDFVALICRHIDASLYVDRTTGRFVLKLVRADYDENALILLDPNNIQQVADFTQPAFGELVNSVTVSYWNVEIGDTATITVQDIALAQQQGANVNTTVTYEGVVDAITASRVAQRDLKTLSTPRISCTIYANQDAKDLNIGDCFKFSWPDYDVSNVVMRVTGIAYGDGKTNRVLIKCTQDVFALPDEAFIVPAPPEWEDPSQPPTPVTRSSVFEVPYLELVQVQGQAAVDSILQTNPDAGYAGAAAVRPTSGINARIYTNNGSGYVDASSLDFSPGATLAEEIDRMADTFAISDLSDATEIQLGTWFQIDDEIMSVEDISTNTITVKRGCLDTVPAPHSIGAALVFWDLYAEADPQEYVASDVIGVKLLTVTGSGQLPLANAPETNITMRSRAIRPYPPADVKINGQYFPTDPLIAIALTWTTRNRVQQTGGVLVGFTDGAVTPEVGTTYTVVVRDNLNAVVLTEAGITSTNYNIPPGIIALMGNSGTIELSSVRDGYESYYRHIIPVAISASFGDNLQFEMDEFQVTPPDGDDLNFIMDEFS
jgi:uncharacterized protein YegL